MTGFEIKPASTKFDPYIYSTFQAFSENKQQITLYLLWLNGIKNNKMRDLMMYSMENNDKKRDGDDMTNLFKPELLRIFKNVKTLNIISKAHSFSFSLSALLSLLIQSKSLEKVTVDGRKSVNWIGCLWSSSSQSITQEFDEKNYTISYTEHCLKINKKQ